MSEPLSREERDELLRRLREVEAQAEPENEALRPERRAVARLWDRYYLLLAEYGDRLPRVLMGACPITGAPLKRAIDPFGLDGPWWWKDQIFDIEEPAAPPTFRVLLGALALRGRTPTETTDEVIPGPAVPYVVPALLQLPGMLAVIGRLDLAQGDVAYPISYWSTETIAPDDLHQPWLRQELWFANRQGSESWLIANDPWDFDLAPWIAQGKVCWLEPGGTRVLGRTSGVACPYLNLPGDRQPQVLAGGERDLADLPDGTPIHPFDDGDDEEEDAD